MVTEWSDMNVMLKVQHQLRPEDQQEKDKEDKKAGQNEGQNKTDVQKENKVSGQKGKEGEKGWCKMADDCLLEAIRRIKNKEKKRMCQRADSDQNRSTV